MLYVRTMTGKDWLYILRQVRSKDTLEKIIDKKNTSSAMLNWPYSGEQPTIGWQR